MLPTDDLIARAHSAPVADEFCTDSEREEQSPTSHAEDDEAEEKRTCSLQEVVSQRNFIRARRRMQRRSVVGMDDEMDCMSAAMSYTALVPSQEPARTSSNPQMDDAEEDITGEPDVFEEQSSAKDPELPPLPGAVSHSSNVVAGLGKRVWRQPSNDAPMGMDEQAIKRCSSSVDHSSPQALERCASSADSSSWSFARTFSSSTRSDQAPSPPPAPLRSPTRLPARSSAPPA